MGIKTTNKKKIYNVTGIYVVGNYQMEIAAFINVI